RSRGRVQPRAVPRGRADGRRRPGPARAAGSPRTAAPHVPAPARVPRGRVRTRGPARARRRGARRPLERGRGFMTTVTEPMPTAVGGDETGPAETRRNLKPSYDGADR